MENGQKYENTHSYVFKRPVLLLAVCLNLPLLLMKDSLAHGTKYLKTFPLEHQEKLKHK